VRGLIAERAQAIVEVQGPVHPDLADGRDEQASLVGLLTDLRHLAEQDGLNFADALDSSLVEFTVDHQPVLNQTDYHHLVASTSRALDLSYEARWPR
jgi:hypothetical protein